ncbi:hypothetical protein HK101_008855 [Irineochytrium annulatum]|nr:hypothetical protein HK101_008855 [Irineochytrium annulatum]
MEDATVALYQKYYPIEVNPHITPQERFKAMEEWWIQAHELIVGLGLTRDMISSMVLSTPVIFRPKLREVMSWCTDHSVPFLVFSAGLYDIIKEVIEKAGLKSESVHVVSNRMRWEKEVCVGFEEPMIHVCNKNEANVEGAPYSVTLKGRDHVILMGDSLGDLDMASGLTPEVLLTIGFLNHNTEQLLPSYMDAFDVVVIDDSGMDFALSILKLMEKRL